MGQKSPVNDIVLQMATRYGNNEAGERLAREGPDLLRAQNSNGDTILHVAARVGNISILQKLLAIYFHQKSLGQNFLSPEVAHIYKDMETLPCIWPPMAVIQESCMS